MAHNDWDIERKVLWQIMVIGEPGLVTYGKLTRRQKLTLDAYRVNQTWDRIAAKKTLEEYIDE